MIIQKEIKNNISKLDAVLIDMEGQIDLVNQNEAYTKEFKRQRVSELEKDYKSQAQKIYDDIDEQMKKVDKILTERIEVRLSLTATYQIELRQRLEVMERIGDRLSLQEAESLIKPYLREKDGIALKMFLPYLESDDPNNKLSGLRGEVLRITTDNTWDYVKDEWEKEKLGFRRSTKLNDRNPVTHLRVMAVFSRLIDNQWPL